MPPRSTRSTRSAPIPTAPVQEKTTKSTKAALKTATRSTRARTRESVSSLQETEASDDDSAATIIPATQTQPSSLSKPAPTTRRSARSQQKPDDEDRVPESSLVGPPVSQLPIASASLLKKKEKKKISLKPKPKPAPAVDPPLRTLSPTPSPGPKTPEVQVCATQETPSTTGRSSNAENRAPELGSSPPVVESTPKRGAAGGGAKLDWSDGEGYTPPPPERGARGTGGRVGSEERPRLRGLEVGSLKPMDLDDDFDIPLPGAGEEKQEEEEEGAGFDVFEEREGSPTPRKQRNARPVPTEEDRAKATEFWIPGMEGEEPFLIYEDSSQRSEDTVVGESEVVPMEGTQRPPDMWDSSDEEEDGDGFFREARRTRRQKQQGSSPLGKRSPEEGSDDENGETPKRRRVGARRGSKAKGKKEVEGEGEEMSTEALRAVLPRRKTTARKKRVPTGVYDIDSTSEMSGDEDELSRPRRRRISKTSKSKPAPTPAKAKTQLLAPVSTIKKPTRTYGQKKKVAEDEHADDRREIGEEMSDTEDDLTPPPESEDTIIMGDGAVIHRDERKKLREVREKFKEVDEWELEFEDVVGSDE